MWHWIAIDLTTMESQYSGPYETKTTAAEGLSATLDLLRTVSPEHARLIAKWRAGKAADDTVTVTPLVLGLYQSDGTDKDAQDQADLWVVDFVGRLPVRVTITPRRA